MLILHAQLGQSDKDSTFSGVRPFRMGVGWVTEPPRGVTITTNLLVAIVQIFH